MGKKQEEKDFVKEALALATPTREVTKQVITAELNRAKAARKNLLGIEKHGKAAIDGKIRELEGELKGVGYRRLSVEPLRWRDSKGMPRLALFSIDKPEAVFHYDGSYLTVPGPGILNLQWVDDDDEEEVAEAEQAKSERPHEFVYADVLEKLEKEYRQSGPDVDEIQYTAVFNGLLPTEVREIAKREKKNFKGLYILAEVTGWKQNIISRPKYADPLLLGWAEPYFYVLAAFDLTPTEEYVQREFTT